METNLRSIGMCKWSESILVVDKNGLFESCNEEVKAWKEPYNNRLMSNEDCFLCDKCVVWHRDK